MKKLGLIISAFLLAFVVAACGGEAVLPTATGVQTTATTTEVATTVAATIAPANVASTISATTPVATGSTTTGTATPTAAAPKPITTVATAPEPGAAKTSTDVLESNSVVDVVKKINPAVVTVYNRSKYSATAGSRNGGNSTNPLPGNGVRVQGIGSGVIISADGLIVTNEHVIDGTDDLTVALNDGKTPVPAKLIGKDKLGDIAVLKIDVPVPGFVKWADKAEVGETVVAIGSALGNFRNSVSKGVVSGLNRTLPGDSSTNVYIQTDAAINSGNSGGPLLNLRGEIVGINTAVVRNTGTVGNTAEGLGFAIPSGVVQVLIKQLIDKGSVSRPYFGITYQMITPAEAGTILGSRTVPNVEGAWISRATGTQSSIVKSSPAEKAGLQDNDVITAVDGIALGDSNPLGTLVLKYRPGDTVKLTVQRGQQTLTLELTFGERPADL